MRLLKSNGSKNVEPYTRGISRIQLLNDKKMWWVMSVYWNKETNEFLIPEKYLDNDQSNPYLKTKKN